MINYEFLVVGVDLCAYYTQQSENLKIFKLIEIGLWIILDVAIRQILHNITAHKIVNKELVITK